MTKFAQHFGALRVAVMGAMLAAFFAVPGLASAATVVTPVTDEGAVAGSIQDAITGKAGLVAAVVVGAIASVALVRLAWVGMRVVGKAIGKLG